MWIAIDEGKTIGEEGSEGGTIIADEAYEGACRITLEKNSEALYSITCGVYGLMVHTAFALSLDEACTKYEGMKHELSTVIDSECEEIEWCESFVEKW